MTERNPPGPTFEKQPNKSKKYSIHFKKRLTSGSQVVIRVSNAMSNAEFGKQQGVTWTGRSQMIQAYGWIQAYGIAVHLL